MVNMFMGVKTIVMNSELPCNFQVQAASLLNEVLKLSEKYEPSTIGACLEIAHHCKIDLNPDLVSEGKLLVARGLKLWYFKGTMDCLFLSCLFNSILWLFYFLCSVIDRG